MEFQSSFRATKRTDVDHGNTYESAPYGVNESYFGHPLSPGSKVGHDHAQHEHQKLQGEKWRAQRDATNPITGSDTTIDEWQARGQVSKDDKLSVRLINSDLTRDARLCWRSGSQHAHRITLERWSSHARCECRQAAKESLPEPWGCCEWKGLGEGQRAHVFNESVCVTTAAEPDYISQETGEPPRLERHAIPRATESQPEPGREPTRPFSEPWAAENTLTRTFR